MPRGVNNYDNGKFQGRNAGTADALSIVSPGLITDGMIINLDAGNFVSYPAAGETWFDLSNRQNNATTINSPTFSNDGVGSIVFNGTSQAASTAAQTGLGSSNRTVDIWFKIVTRIATATNRILTLSADNGATDQTAMNLYYTNTGQEDLVIAMGGSPFDCTIFLQTTPALNAWYNVTGSVTGNVLSGYLNGQFIASDTNTGSIGANPILQLARYNANYNQFANVKIASVKVYNRALTPEEVSQNFNATRARFGV